MTRPCRSLHALALLVLRLSIGATFIAHGTMKWSMWTDPDGSSLMKFLSIVEPVGGVALILGFLTPWAAFGLAVIMCGAIWRKVGGGGAFAGGQGSWECDAVLLAGNLVLMSIGAGRWSVDAFMRRAEAESV